MRHHPKAGEPVSVDAAVKYLVGDLNVESGRIHLARHSAHGEGQGRVCVHQGPLSLYACRADGDSVLLASAAAKASATPPPAASSIRQEVTFWAFFLFGRMSESTVERARAVAFWQVVQCAPRVPRGWSRLSFIYLERCTVLPAPAGLVRWRRGRSGVAPAPAGDGLLVIGSWRVCSWTRHSTAHAATWRTYYEEPPDLQRSRWS